MGKGIHLARIGGIDIDLDWSLLIIFALVSAALGSGLFPRWHPEWSAMTCWLTALAAATAFFASVLLHELSHAWVGRSQGVAVRRITLFVFGGMAHIEHEPTSWRAELLMAIVGPLTSLTLGTACILLAVAASGTLSLPGTPQQAMESLGPLSTLLLWLGPVNVILAVFNLVPGFPLDGGRVLRAALWGATGDLRRATQWASISGRTFAWMLIVCGVAMALGFGIPLLGGGVVNGLWIALIGWFLHNAALMSYQQLLLRQSLGEISVSRLANTRLQSVPPDLTVRAFVDEYLMRSDQDVYPVIDGSAFIGLFAAANVRRLPQSEWSAHTVGDAMTVLGKLKTIDADDDAFAATQALTRNRIDRLPVVRGRQLIGFVSWGDVFKWLAVHGYGNVPVPGA